MEKFIIFTDLDGTLLDYSTYSFEKALPALELLRRQSIPLILCSSKTKAEIEYYRKKLANAHPFISENGGGIFIAKKYFHSEICAASYPLEEQGDYYVIRLGARYPDLRQAVIQLREEGFKVKGFGDMTPEELSGVARLNLEEAVMAKERDFDEPFILQESEEETPKLFASITKKGFKFTQGVFFHILGNSNKGTAMTLLSDLYRKEFDEIVTIAIGDSLNDLPMLERADYPVIVQKPDGSYDPRINVPQLIKADGIGPDGWNNAVIKLTEILLKK